VLGVLYPVLLSVVVMATANHYLVDVLAGVVTVMLASRIVKLLTRAGVVLRPGAEPRDAPATAQPSGV
jgi:hypothetical protein